jgi:hypothetical protein
MLDYLQTIFDAVFFAFALASIPIALILILYNTSPLGGLVMGFPLCWVRLHA